MTDTPTETLKNVVDHPRANPGAGANFRGVLTALQELHRRLEETQAKAADLARVLGARIPAQQPPRATAGPTSPIYDQLAATVLALAATTAQITATIEASRDTTK